MANKYVDQVVLTQGLNSMAQSVSKNFAFKKQSIKDIKIAPAIPSDRTDPSDTSLVNCLVITYADDKLVDKLGNTVNHVVNVELGDLGSKIENWVSGTDYKEESIVIYKQHLYKCIVEPQADNTTFDETEWTLFGLDDREKALLDRLKVEELKEDAVDVNKVTGYKITFKNLDENGDPIESELAQVKDLPKLLIDDTISKTDPKASEKTLSAKYVLEAIETLSGTDLSSFAKKTDVFFHHTTYTRCLSSDEGAKEVVAAVTDSATQVAYDDVVLQIADITLGEYVVTGIAYDAPLFVEKEGSLYKDVLSQFTINVLKENPDDVDEITGYELLYRGNKLYSQANKETTDLDFSTLDVKLPTATDEEMAALYTTLYNKVFNDPSYVEEDIQDPDMATLYETIYNKVFGETP